MSVEGTTSEPVLSSGREAALPRGLSAVEAKRRAADEGPNEPAPPRGFGRLRLFAEVVREPLILLLLAAGAIYALLGEPRDAVLLLVSDGVIIALSFYQAARTENALRALQHLSEPEARVYRDGRPTQVPMREVVRGDWVVLTEGTRVPADGWVREATELTVDESVLTGESVPVTKSVAQGSSEWSRPGGDRQPFVYAQTLVFRGQGLAEVRATGPRTEAGQIAGSLARLDRTPPILQRQTRALVFSISLLALVLSVAVVVLVGLATGNWLDGLLAGIALTIALLPEEIPIVLTVYTALGARRLSRRTPLARRLAAIPTLGALTVLCTDKTGTLTEGRMKVVRTVAFAEGERSPSEEPAAVRDLVARTAFASDPVAPDPMEAAIFEHARGLGVRVPATEEALLRRYPLTRDRLYVARAWQAAPGRAVVSLKGAPEAVLGLCRLPEERRTDWKDRAEAMAATGLRVLGVGEAAAAASELPAEPQGLAFDFRGLVGLADPMRPGVPAAIRESLEAGIRVVLVTGDHPGTARSLAEAAGIERPSRVVTGPETEGMDDERFSETAATVNVFARFRPDEKLRLVNALQRRGEVVGMTGDGVNDAPALKAADIGLAMGLRGTDVAREAASIVILDDAFPTIVDAVGIGRRIYANIRKAIGYLLAVHVVIAGMAFLPALLGLPLVILPAEIVFLQFLIDPTSALSFEAEPEEPDLMTTPPRSSRAPVVNRRVIGFSLLQGASGLLATFAVYYAAVGEGMGDSRARGLAFATLVLANLFLIFVNRSRSVRFPASLRIPNRVLWVVLAAGLAILGTALYWPPVSQLFGFAPPPLPWTVAAFLAAGFSTLWVETIKPWALREPPRGTRTGPPAAARN